MAHSKPLLELDTPCDMPDILTLSIVKFDDDRRTLGVVCPQWLYTTVIDDEDGCGFPAGTRYVSFKLIPNLYSCSAMNLRAPLLNVVLVLFLKLY